MRFAMRFCLTRKARASGNGRLALFAEHRGDVAALEFAGGGARQGVWGESGMDKGDLSAE